MPPQLLTRLLRDSAVCLALIVMVAALTCRASSKKSPLPLTIAAATAPYFSLPFIAEKQGYMEQFGLRSTLLRTSSGREALSLVLEGKADVATVHLRPIITALVAGHDLSIITSMAKARYIHELVGRKDRGIRNLRDVKGKKIGVPRNTSAEYVLQIMLAGEDIGAEDVALVSVEPETLLQALKEGGVDAVVAWHPYSGQVEAAFAPDALTRILSDLDVGMSLLVCARKTCKAKAEELTRMLQAMTQAVNYAEGFARKNQKLEDVEFGSIGGDKPGLRWKDVQFDLSLDNALLTFLNMDLEAYMKSAGGAKEIEFESVVEPSLLLSVNREAVTLR